MASATLVVSTFCWFSSSFLAAGAGAAAAVSVVVHVAVDDDHNRIDRAVVSDDDLSSFGTTNG